MGRSTERRGTRQAARNRHRATWNAMVPDPVTTQAGPWVKGSRAWVCSNVPHGQDEGPRVSPEPLERPPTSGEPQSSCCGGRALAIETSEEISSTETRPETKSSIAFSSTEVIDSPSRFARAAAAS